MSDGTLQPLADDIASLLAAERDAPVPVGAEQRVYARVENTLASAPAVASGSAAASIKPILFAIVAAVLGIGGAAFYLASDGASPALEDVPVVAEPSANVEPRPSRVQAGAVEPGVHAAPVARDTLAAERAVLDRAQASILERDGELALTAVEQHMRRFRRGKLVEEREALRVQALVIAGRHDDARRYGARFLSRYPRSIQRGAVGAALEAMP